MPVLPGPQNVGTGMETGALPVVKVSEGGATYPSWSEDGTLNWSLGATFFSTTIEDAMAEDFEAITEGRSITQRVIADKSDTTVLLQNATIITMADEDGGVLENADILIEGDRIKEIGEDLTAPRGAKTVDLEGKTIVPGFIDAHAHGPQGTDELIPQQNWEAVATLALGVTTIFDPSSRASEIFAASEMQRAGMLLAPRTYSTGEVIYGAKAPPQEFIYDDVIQMYGQTNVAYTPTLAVTYGGIRGETPLRPPYQRNSWKLACLSPLGRMVSAKASRRIGRCGALRAAA